MPTDLSSNKIKAGTPYQTAMELLRRYTFEKTTSGDYLWAKSKDADLLTYPDAGGTCSITFYKGKLSACSGCSSALFACE